MWVIWELCIIFTVCKSKPMLKLKVYFKINLNTTYRFFLNQIESQFHSLSTVALDKSLNISSLTYKKITVSTAQNGYEVEIQKKLVSSTLTLDSIKMHFSKTGAEVHFHWPRSISPLHLLEILVNNARCRSDQIRSVAQSCPTLCHPMNRSMPGLPVHHQLPEFTQTHVH